MSRVIERFEVSLSAVVLSTVIGALRTFARLTHAR